jgi:hypothetical protein
MTGDGASVGVKSPAGGESHDDANAPAAVKILVGYRSIDSMRHGDQSQ